MALASPRDCSSVLCMLDVWHPILARKDLQKLGLFSLSPCPVPLEPFATPFQVISRKTITPTHGLSHFQRDLLQHPSEAATQLYFPQGADFQ